MAVQTREYLSFVRQVARRRRDLLKDEHRRLILPPPGVAWTPNDKEQSLSEAFIVFFIAELETYLEAVVSASLRMYQDSLIASGLAECTGATSYVDKIQDKTKRWQKNNNTSWGRTSEFWEFVGLDQSKFPVGLWDHINQITSDRGDIAHNSFGARIVKDPRLTMKSVGIVLSKLRLFDRDFKVWVEARDNELERFRSCPIVFIPGVGSIAPG